MTPPHAHHQLLQKILKDNGHSLTTPRLLVCDLLWQHEPQTIAELYARCRDQIDRASLYRTLSLFEQLGIVQKIYIGWKHKYELSDIFSHHHHHLSCLGCGKIIAIAEESAVEQFIANLASHHNFIAQNHQLEIRGYCPSCQDSA